VSRLARLAERIGEYAGLDPPPWLLDARVRERAAACGLDEAAYLARAVDDRDELARLADLLRVGETRFFRHRAHVEALRARVLPERGRAAAAAGRPLRAWSAGCASGEEAWTLAMLLDDAAPPSGWEVLATDLSRAALATAEAARYPAARVDDVPERLRRCFREAAGGQLAVEPRLRARVRFELHNLLEARYPRGLDVVLCRNVLIYFATQQRERVMARLADALAPGGYLFLGYAETLRAHDGFEAVRDEDGVVYRRRAAPLPAPAPAPVPAAAPAPAPVAAPAAAPAVALHGDYPDGERLAAALRPLVAAGPRRAIVDLDGAAFLGEEAARVLRRAAHALPGLELRASRPPVRRWLARHGLLRSHS
jgi:chemotaxis protein methyltransferase CheR